MRRFPRLMFVLIPVLIFACMSFAADKGHKGSRILQYEIQAKDFTSLLAGHPESIKMESGVVVLEPGKSAGKHSTKSYEEIVIVLEGQGKLICSDGSQLEIMQGKAAYSPPGTEHDVKNTGKGVLRYIFVASDTR